MKKSENEKKTPSTRETKDINNFAAELDRRREWRLALPLKADVEGTLPDGSKFKEKTTLNNISSTGAYFNLTANITIGSRLKLTINLPSSLTEGKKVNLQLKGKAVRLEQPESKEKRKGIALQFDKEFKFVNNENN